MALLEQIEREMEDLAMAYHEAVQKLQARKKELIRKYLLLCRGCKKRSRLSAWGFIQKMYYVSPSGCNEGGYWDDHHAETCDIVCPKCGAGNYLYNHPQRDLIVSMVARGIGKDELFARVTKEPDRA